MVTLAFTVKLFPYKLSSTVVYSEIHGLLVFSLHISHSSISLQPGVLEHLCFFSTLINRYNASGVVHARRGKVIELIVGVECQGKETNKRETMERHLLWMFSVRAIR